MTTPQGNPYAQQPHPNPYAQQGGYPQPGGYAVGVGGYPQGVSVAAGGGSWPGQGPFSVCRFCGSAPAVDVTFRAHRGLLVLMTFRKLEGPMCHACGTRVYKQLTTETLWQGWWSPLSLVLFTPLTLLWNVIASAKVKKLQAPAPAGY
ncbi:hypothetical protein ACFSL4_35620 [Streptomyces caeni]|uniref:Toxin-antitoxin system, toxin component n=1 Tax=Streptomyces caeni TaxID=2307231 RepID=A0ABW4J2J5_9ACTN